MMGTHLAGFALLVLLASASAGETELDARLEAVLTEDDQCAPGAECALNALQIKAVRNASEAAEDDLVAASADEDPCKSGMVGRIRAQGPECFDACPQMCEPMAEAIRAFFRRGGAPAVKRVVCRHQEAFYCPLLYSNLKKCESFAIKARKMRIGLPETIPAMQEQCKGRR